MCIRDRANILEISKSIKLLVKMKNVSFILWKKHMKFSTNPYFQGSKNLKNWGEKEQEA